jgi:uncharacterized DUF497 family protein
MNGSGLPISTNTGWILPMSGAFDWDRAVILAGKADRFGKQRLKAVGYYEGRIAVVIFAMLGSEAVSIISFRPAKAKEKKVLE